MKKGGIKILLFVIVLVFIYILFNQIDSPAPPDIFTEKDLVPTTYEKRNGFYLVMAFTEPPGIDIQSENIISKYRRICDPQFANEDPPKDWDYRAYQKAFEKYRRPSRFIHRYKKDWVEFVNLKKKEIEDLAGKFSFFLDRYGKLLDSEVVSDFTESRFRVDETALLTIAKLYTALEIMKAQTNNGDISGLLSQLHLGRKLIAAARSVFTNSIGKRLVQESLAALNGLMNRNENPGEMAGRVLSALPPLKTGALGSRNAFISYFLAAGRWMEVVIERRSREGNVDFGKKMKMVARVFFQKQRTKNYYFYYISNCLEYENKPPYEWESETLTPESLHKKTLWFLQNPTGKFIFSEDMRPDFRADILETHRTKILYDLTRLSAEFHLKFTKETPVDVIHGHLRACGLKDPYSGKPYLWNHDKERLYSIGPNRKDDGGQFDPRKHNKEDPPDIAVSCNISYNPNLNITGGYNGY